MTAARAFARQKPIIAFKAGRFPASAQAAASHTGAMASEDAVYDAAFQRTGIARVSDLGDVFDCAELIGRGKIPRGPRLGHRDQRRRARASSPPTRSSRSSGVLATLVAGDDGAGSTRACRPPGRTATRWTCWATPTPSASRRPCRAVLADPGVDAVLAIVTPQAMTNPTATAARARQARAGEPEAAAGGAGSAAGPCARGCGILAEGGVAAYPTPEQAVRAFMTLVAYARNLETLYETPKDVAIQFPYDRAEAKRALRGRAARRPATFSPRTSPRS